MTNKKFVDLPALTTMTNSTIVPVSDGTTKKITGSDLKTYFQSGGYGNSNVATYLASYGSNTISTTGNVSVGNIIGNGQALTGLTGANVSGAVTYATTANSVAVANVSGIGNIATINKDGNASNILYGNGVFASAPAGSSYGNSNVATFLASFGSNVISTTGNVTATKFIGDGSSLTNVTVNAAGNIVGTSSNVSLVAGSFTATFDNTGVLTLPTNGGDEGGELRLGVPATNTTLTSRVTVDVYQDRFRIFDGSTKGVYVDLSQAGSGVSTLLNNRVSGFVNAGTFVTMDLIKATVTTTGSRGLSLATTTGTFVYNIGGNFGMNGNGSGGQSLASQTLTTTATSSIFGWGFGATGDISTYILTDTTNSRCYRITVMIGASFNNNAITIERLI